MLLRLVTPHTSVELPLVEDVDIITGQNLSSSPGLENLTPDPHDIVLGVPGQPPRPEIGKE